MIQHRCVRFCRRLGRARLTIACAAAVALCLVFTTVFLFDRKSPAPLRIQAEAVRYTPSNNGERWSGSPINRKHLDNLKWNYLMNEKELDYVGHDQWMTMLGPKHPLYGNVLAVFAKPSRGHEHGLLGTHPNGTIVWKSLTKPMPPSYNSLNSEKQKEVLRERGFYSALSDALPIDRPVMDHRDDVCQTEHYNLPEYADASVVITFVNEPLSTLLRTVYSVLNNTPAPILREIILVDDHSDLAENIPGGELYRQIRYLPKVKLMSLAERRGIVQARLTGARAAQGRVLVILDSHIEVNPGWLEPQLKRIHESPTSLVFPQILGLSPTTFEQKTTSGIGCYVSWRWAIVEQSTLTGTVKTPAAIPSPSMAGGLFAVDRQFFFEIGGYDENFIAWGAENVELAFRTWMCGGRVECAPCSKTYHIFRKGSTGYQNPVGALWTNRMRTARVWLDAYYQISAPMIDMSAVPHPSKSFGNIDIMLKLKRNLQCKPFEWFLKNVDPSHDTQSLSDVLILGRIGGSDDNCMDLMGNRAPPAKLMVYHCHRSGNVYGNQGFFITEGDKRIRLMANDKRCVIWSVKTQSIEMVHCNDAQSRQWEFDWGDFMSNRTRSFNAMWGGKCLGISQKGFIVSSCTHEKTLWGDAFIADPNFEFPEIESSRLRGTK